MTATAWLPNGPRWRSRAGALAAVLLVGGLIACGSGSGSDSGTALSSPAGKWISEFERDHPLTGRVWQPTRQRFADAASLLVAVGRSDFVLIGERHDNPDHHRLQAWLVDRMIEGERRMAVAFEMFTVDQAPEIAAHLRDNPKDAKGLGAAVGWAKTGWPDWDLYRPIAQAALDAGLPVAAAGLGRATVRAIGRRGEGALAPDVRARLGDLRPSDDAVKTAMADEMRKSHCNMLSDAVAEKMVVVQRARDAHMAASVVAAATQPDLDGAVLISGAGHVRTDHGVPEFLRRIAPGRKVLSIGLVESLPDRQAPEGYAKNLGVQALPFDFVWFTPRFDPADPCEAHAGALRRFNRK
jgi:uncharacterized iron-regulated protein